MKLSGEKKALFYFLFSVLIIIVLTSCGSNTVNQGTVSYDGENLNVDFPTPRFLALSSPITSLKAQATINNETPHPLIVDPTTNQVHGTINGVPSGNHTLCITYFVSTSSGDVVLCSYSTKVSISPGKITTVNIQDTDLDRNIDDDQDGFTNLAEVKIGTDPLSEFDAPQSESPYAMCGNGITQSLASPNFQFTTIVGSAVAGTATSKNYKLMISFSGHK